MLKSKLLFAILLIAVLCSSLYWAGSHYKYDIYDAAISFERKQAQLTAKHIQVDSLDIAYLEGPRRVGDQTLLLIHGFGAAKENWIRFSAQLTDRFHVVIIDLPGHGESSQDLTFNYGLEHQVEFVHQIVQTLGLGQFNIAGNSMGGAIAALYAANYPNEIRTVALYDPAGIHDVESDLEKHLREGVNPLIVSDTESFERLLKFAMEKPPFIPWPITEAAAAKASQKQKINAKIFTDISSGDRALFKTEIAKINTPTLIIWGTEDRVINVKNADAFEQLIKGSTKIIMQGIGHVPMMEVPKESAEMLADFVNNPA
ncbi:alpha/beta fold hydrolase [Alkalimarinus alittae]|uniref:Alpha/beta hydrolase n=1 Tax=Alkalimarinus alittae TaxID=2961619 RepID=A0ABY6N2K1_9ALTE|nr:alpha/beta hydrolase [Alkalimarinus alittae]UZE96314.1 alpha/beta hydrolase [Alkalimarinus alittae]